MCSSIPRLTLHHKEIKQLAVTLISTVGKIYRILQCDVDIL